MERASLRAFLPRGTDFPNTRRNSYSNYLRVTPKLHSDRPMTEEEWEAERVRDYEPSGGNNGCRYRDRNHIAFGDLTLSEELTGHTPGKAALGESKKRVSPARAWSNASRTLLNVGL